MNAFAAQYFILNEVTAVLAQLVALGIGAAICHVRRTVTAELRRAPYFVAVAGVSLLPLGILILGVAMPGAAVSGTIWLLVLTQLGIGVVGGYALYWASSARSNDMIGDRGLAWLGLIPLVNLVLIFKGREARLPPREREAGTGETAGLILIGLVILLVGRGIEAAVVESLSGLTWQRSLDDVIAQRPAGPPKSLAERFAEEAAAAQPDLPFQISAGESLISVTADGTALTLTYLYDSESFPPFTPYIIDQSRRELCRDRSFRAEIAEGGQIIYRYTRPDGLVLGTIIVSQRTC